MTSRIKLILLVSIVCSSAFAQTSTPSKQLRVGAILSLSGDLAYFGKAIQRGIDLALSEDVHSGIKLIFEDDRSAERRTSIDAANKLILKDKVSVLLLNAMPNLAVVHPLCLKHKIVCLTLWDSNASLAKMNEFSFGFGWSNELTAERMAEVAFKQLSIKKFALVTGNDEWSEILSRAFKAKIEELGASIVFENNVDLQEADFRSMILRIKKSEAQGLYFPLYLSSIVSLVKQVRTADLNLELLTAEGLADNEIRQLGPLAEGIYLTQVWFSNADFENKYKQKYKINALDLNLGHVALGYDVVGFLKQVIKTHNNTEIDGTKLQESMGKTVYEGILGIVDFTNSRITNRSQRVLEVKDQKLRSIAE